MELPIVIVLASVLTLVTLVTATPYGYGVKSGASAKAEATAVAGPFGNVGPVPLSIPSGASYSGSFSKSSASSFASSSASSSSSSFSFSGSGANGIPDIGAAGLGSKGCSTGSCPGGDANSSPLNGAQQFGGANAVATAQAKALSGSYTPCQGSKCNDPSEKCTSGQCSLNFDNNNKAQDESSKPGIETSSETECISGQCKKDEDKEDSDDSNDFAVNIDRNLKSNPSHEVSGHYSNKQKPSQSGCSNGKCGSPNSYPNSATYNQNRQPIPATYLTTPNHNEPCTTPNCNYPTQGYGPENGGLPSSYNVPLQSATNPPNTAYHTSENAYEPGSQLNQNHNNPSIPCTSSNCNSGSTSNGYYHFAQGETNNEENCISGKCDLHSPEKALDSGVVSGTNSPTSFSSTSRPSGQFGPAGCTTPNCAERTSNQPNLGSHAVPAYSTLPENKQNNNCRGADCKGPSYTGSLRNPSDAPVYTGGFGGPAGSIETPWTGNKQAGNAVNQYNPTHSSGFGKPIGSFGTVGLNERGSSNHYGSASGTPIAGRPTGTSPTGTHPSYTSGITHPGNNGVPSSTIFNSGSSPAYNGGLQSNTGETHYNSGYNAIQESFGVTKPSTAPNHQSGATYTGGFGGPTGTSSIGALKPGASNCGLSGCHGQSNPYDIAGASSHSKPPYIGGFGGPTGTLGFPSPTLGSGVQKPETGNCGYAGCNGQANHNSGTTPYDTTKPNGVTPSQTRPTYTSGFGGQTGASGAASPTLGSGVQKPETANCGYAGCKGQANQNSGTTHYDITKPNGVFPSQTHPSYTGGFGGPTGTSGTPIPTSGYNGVNKPGTTNCEFAGCHGQSSYNSNNNGGLTPHDATKPTTATSSQTKPTYTGGFGGPAGTIDTPSLSSGAPGAHQPGTSNCGHAGCNVQLDVNENGGVPDHSGYTGTTSYDKTKPNIETSSQTKPAYTGGFGGPSGFLKPNEFSVPSTPSSVKSTCTTGHCIPKDEILSKHNQGHSLSGAQSLASASASSNAVAYTGGFGGPPGLLKPYDEGKLENHSGGKSGISSPSYNTPSLGTPSAAGKIGNLNNGENHAVKSLATASVTATAGGNSSNGPSGGCNNGCPNNGSNADLGFPAGSVASAKSVAGAKSFGLGGSFASSSATAHASAGAATKGGYGRK